MGVEGQPFATGQLRSYMRAPVGYYCAQLLSQNGTPCIVMGTGTAVVRASSENPRLELPERECVQRRSYCDALGVGCSLRFFFGS